MLMFINALKSKLLSYFLYTDLYMVIQLRVLLIYVLFIQMIINYFVILLYHNK